MKQRSVLLDANIIIVSHELNVWHHLTSSFSISVPSIVAQNEVKYFKVAGKSMAIQLAPLIAAKQITEFSADTSELGNLILNFSYPFSHSIDPGEQEALALFLAKKCEDHEFCTADAGPIQALAMLGMEARGVSFEALLAAINQSVPIERQFTRAFFDRNVKEGKRRRSEGDGLSISSTFRR
jgi:hypothetical protein